MSEKKRLSFEENIFLCELFLVLVINAGTIFKIASLSSIAFTVSIILVMVLIVGRLRKFDIYVFLFAIIAILGVVFTGIINGAMLMSFDYYRKYLLALSTAIIFYMASTISISLKLVKWIKKISVLLAVFYVVAFYILGKQETLAGGITLNFVNPNFTAFWLVIAVLYSIYNLVTERSFILKIFFGCLSAILMVMVNNTLARSAIMTLIIFFALLLVGVIRKKYRFSNRVIAGVVVLPLIIGILYMNFVNNDKILELFSFMEGDGKSLLSRKNIWQTALEILKNHLWFGNYYKATGGTGLSQLHNTHIDLLVSYGLIAFLAFIKVLYCSLQRTVRKINSFPQYVGISAVVAVIFLGSFEAALISGGLGINYWVACFLICARYSGEERIRSE